MIITKDYTYLNDAKPVDYKDWYDESTASEFQTLVHTFGSRKVFDALIQKVSKKDFLVFLDVNYFDDQDEFFEECHRESIYDVYFSAADAIFDMAIINDNDWKWLTTTLRGENK